MKELLEIQTRLKAPKSAYNKFGKYNYRSADDILEAVKPLCAELKCVITGMEEVNQGDGVWPYINHAVTITNSEGEKIIANGVAGIEKAGGMSLPQAFGSASSYAKKYALGNLFAIDDTKDADATNDHKPAKKPAINTKPAIDALQAVKDGAELKKAWLNLPEATRNIKEVEDAKNAMKAKLGL